LEEEPVASLFCFIFPITPTREIFFPPLGHWRLAFICGPSAEGPAASGVDIGGGGWVEIGKCI